MPVTIKTTEIDELTRITLSGKVSLSELTRALNDYALKGPTRLELYDIARLDEDRFTAEEIDELAHYLREAPNQRPPGSKTAVIAAHTVDIGLTRMLSSLAEDTVSYEMEAFRSEEEAMDWLLK